MSQGFSKTTIVGNLGDAPEMRYTQAGKALTKMSVAVNTGFGEHERTDWHDVVVWGSQAEACNEHLSKGSRVLVHGQMRKSIWEGDDGQKHSRWELNAREVVFLGGNSSTAQEPVQEDDVPF
ncbi:MAG: single-stranded DNA-binding protein [Chloroflexota bacterium]|nr:single-stranded DNA-binding protein [Chloroflexota bacterium]